MLPWVNDPRRRPYRQQLLLRSSSVRAVWPELPDGLVPRSAAKAVADYRKALSTKGSPKPMDFKRTSCWPLTVDSKLKAGPFI